MKTKNLSTKLGLNKNTIANLNSEQLRQAHGGGTAVSMELTGCDACESALCLHTDKETICYGATCFTG